MPDPLVSVALPVHDGERYLDEAIASILGQGFRDLELILLDNASRDGTRAIGEKWAVEDPRVVFHRQPRLVSGADNYGDGLRLARGRYFKWAAHDDLLHPDYLERCVGVLEARPEVVLCHADARIVDAEGRVVRDAPRSLHRVSSPDPAERFRDLVLVPHSCFAISAVMRREVLSGTPGLGRFLGADRVLLAELSLHGPFHLVPEPLFWSREHPGRSTRAQRGRGRATWYDLSSADRILLPWWRRLAEYARAIERAPIDRRTRARCRRVMAIWAWRHRNGLARNLAAAAVEGGRRAVRPRTIGP